MQGGLVGAVVKPAQLVPDIRLQPLGDRNGESLELVLGLPPHDLVGKTGLDQVDQFGGRRRLCGPPSPATDGRRSSRPISGAQRRNTHLFIEYQIVNLVFYIH
jgi:hypothetical protein